jgi:nucleotide-binding universal stress UspA family protein
LFNSILVPLDGSLLAECVLSHTAAIGRAFKVKAVLLQVVSRDQQNFSAQLSDLVDWQIHKTEAASYLGEICERLKNSGVDTDVAVQEGKSAESILEFAECQKIDLIILSSHGHSGVSQWGISSVTQKIIHSAPGSVLLIRAQQAADSEGMGQAYKRILVPLDGSLRAENVLPIIAHLARFHKSQIHIARVVTTPEMAHQLPLAQEDLDLSNRVVARNKEESIHYLEQVRQRALLNGIPVQSHLLDSENALAALHGLVEQENIDLVVLSAHGYSGNNQWLYGSIVNNFVLHSPVPLLIVQDLAEKEEPFLADRSVMERDRGRSERIDIRAVRSVRNGY